MTTEKYKIKGGVKEFESYVKAVKVAEMKASENDTPVIVSKRTPKEMEEVIKVFPDGSTESLE